MLCADPRLVVSTSHGGECVRAPLIAQGRASLKRLRAPLVTTPVEPARGVTQQELQRVQNTTLLINMLMFIN